MIDADCAATLSQEAMGTAFTITAHHARAEYARRAIRAAFDELAWLEDRLSRFRDASDVARLNRLRPGETITVAPETQACLRAALTVAEATGGAFDAAYASGTVPILAQQKWDCPLHAPYSARIELGADSTVRVLSAGMRLDLGGIGKGCALDRMAAVLDDWDLDSVVLWASTSTVLAKGQELPLRIELAGSGTVSIFGGAGTVWAPTGYPLAGGGGRRWSASAAKWDCPPWQNVLLKDAALSASGIAFQGSHIIDPRTGRAAERRSRAWAQAPTATEADALSTAFFVMSDTEIAEYARQHHEVTAYVPFSGRGHRGAGFQPATNTADWEICPTVVRQIAQSAPQGMENSDETT
jgi:FAD:protein FMN transferase